ncbi:protein phosphatase 1 regulatory subunit 11-like [Stylophora pistillata]|uniref:E3 ubiquitin-protein ligase PPP1R11 n=1 Tax=Stylophora pistillata TaxID=50429 RepID=A0A2B4SXT3_STYPI|nr:protein phosphatase 1 regulatory subunit 11-like [Stylophora pistillata]PFX33923.1 Protein phosphatase 1 regulatory subunit 11 [Stylophora pistillata]
MAECPESSSDTVTVTEETSGSPSQQRLVLKLKKPKSEKKVQWDASAVDNEFMGKKTSKCCCIYSKPKVFGDSSSESDSDDDDGCGHNSYCTGHKKKSYGHPHDHNNKGDEPASLNSNPNANS